MGLAPSGTARTPGETAVVRCLSQFFNTLLAVDEPAGLNEADHAA
jgi:hypothetical protein